MSIKNEHQSAIQNVKAISGEFQHALVVADIDKKIKNVLRKTPTDRRKIGLLKDVRSGSDLMKN